LTFGNPDKVSLHIGGGRESTLKRWHSEGLPLGVDPANFVLGELGIQVEKRQETPGFFVNARMIPIFEEKVLSHENGHYIVQDWMGAITEISDQYDYTYIRNAIDFVTRKWHKFPVETREDWEDMKKRFNPHEPGRLPANIAELGGLLKNRTYPLVISINGPFWQLREWMGMENLCIAFIDQPEFVAEMIEFWTEFVLALLGDLLPHVQPDNIHFSEDMAYKAHSMIGPAMTRDFIQPSYAKWVKLAKSFGVPIVDMDSDGFIEKLIPIWIDSGINVCDPIEVAAGNDIVRFQELFGKRMAYIGGIDKRAMAKGGKILEDEIKRVAPVVESGACIPGCDHGIPSDVSFANYRQFVSLVAKITGWL
jgi:uroporphyrinogen decarboxylase